MDREGLKERVCQVVDEMQGELLRVSHAIHANPELAFEEHQAAALLVDALEKADLDVTRPAYGLDTAFETELGSEGPCAVGIVRRQTVFGQELWPRPLEGWPCRNEREGRPARLAGCACGWIGSPIPSSRSPNATTPTPSSSRSR